MVYLPYSTNPVPTITLLARSTNHTGAAALLRQEVGALDSDLPLWDVKR
jgi:hypothetical protein